MTNLIDLNNVHESEYLEPCDVEQLSLSKSNSLNAIHLNIRGLGGKRDKLELLVKSFEERAYRLDIIMVCETFINKNNKNVCAIDGYNFEQKFRSSKMGGGVGIYITKSAKYVMRDDLAVFVEGIYESVFIELLNEKGKNIIVGEVYRVPGTDEKLFLENIKCLLDKTKKEKKQLLMGSDQNMDYLKINFHFNTNKLFDLVTAYGAIPVITKPTRITNSSATLIDNIYINMELTSDYKSAILLYDISDHLPCFISINYKIDIWKNIKQVYKKRIFDRNNILALKNKLVELNTMQFETLNCEQSFNLFSTFLLNTLNTTCPEKEFYLGKNKVRRQPWVTKGILTSSHKCNRLYRKTIGKAKTDVNVIKYHKYRNIYNKLKTKCKIEYYKNKINLFKHDSKNLWKTYNNLLGKLNNKAETIDYLKVNNNKIYNKTDIANLFSEHYATIGKSIASKISPSNKAYDQYLKERTSNSLFIAPTTEREIENIIRKLPNKTSSGTDGISNKLLKQIIVEIASPLQIIFNKSFIEGVVPSKMKTALITPIYKSKNKTDINNYRPVSLLTNISKILEKLMHNRVNSFLEKNNILYQSQYGFRSNMGTIDAITELIGTTLKNLDNKNFSLVIFLDLSKAFDTLDHNILLHKLYHYGIRGTAYNWFDSYLTDRKHSVKIKCENKTHYSKLQSINTGVPQGSVLGPLLFLIYVNDLQNSLELLKSINFADDTNLIFQSKDINELFMETQYDLNNAIDWFNANKLSVNASKTNYMIFKPRGAQGVTDLNSLKMNDKIIKEVDKIKFLGLNIDNKLNWTTQVYYIKAKLNQCEYLLKRFHFLLPEESLKTIYYAHAFSHLSYGIHVWGPMLNISQQKLLDNSHSRCVRQIKKTALNINKESIHKSMKILDMDNLISLELSKLAFKFKQETLPTNIKNLFPKTTIHKYQTRNKAAPAIQKVRTCIFANSFLTETNKAWTKLTQDVKNSTTLKSFSKKFKNNIFK